MRLRYGRDDKVVAANSRVGDDGLDAGLKRRVGTTVQVMLALCLLVYAVDWGWLHLRISQVSTFGAAFGSVQVEQYLKTPLKGNKAEYDYMGTVAEACSNSLFPQADRSPCWWLRRHPTDWQQ